MHREKRRFGQDPANVVRSSDRTFYAPLGWHEPRYIFACSWGDFFHPAADEWRPDAWDVIRRCPQHTWLILTKRPELVAARLPEGWPWPHVGLGITAENQRRFDERAPEILAIPAALHFVSHEPLLGLINTALEDDVARRLAALGYLGRFRWYIAGGESGPNARPTNPDWVRYLRDQARAVGAFFNFKQWGEWRRPDGLSEESYYFIERLEDGSTGGRIPEDSAARNRLLAYVAGVGTFVRVGKKRAGRLLDNEIWDERPPPLGKR
jgi:protein gp37